MQNKALTVILALTSLSLAACGGGGGGDGGGMTNPPPASGNSSLTNLTASETFSTTAGTISGRLTSATSVDNVSSEQGDIGNDVTVAYDVDADSYTVKVRQNNVSSTTAFLPADINAGSSTANVTEYDRTVNGDDQTLLLFNPGNALADLSYVTYGAWQHQHQGTTTLDFDTSFFVFGIRTPSSEMPTSGTADYAAAIDGYWTDSSGLSALNGSAALSADFGAGTVDGEFDISGTNVNTAATKAFDTFTGTADISDNTFSGALDGTNTNYSGDWDGGFFGPNAKEIGGSFRVKDGGNQAIGVFVGKK